jgi:uncharacterized membrane protein
MTKNSILKLVFSSVIAGVISVTPLKAADYLLLTDLGTSAKMLGIAGIEGFSDSANAVFDNPAGLYRFDNSSMSLFTTTLMGEAVFVNGSIAAETPFGRIGVGYMEATVTDIPHTGIIPASLNFNQPFYVKSYFDYKNTIVKLSYQVDLNDNFSLGLSGTRYSNEYFDVTGEGFNGDVGLVYISDDFEVSFLARNVVPNLKVEYADGATEDLVTQLIAGVSYRYWDLVPYLQYKNSQSSGLFSGGLTYIPSMFEHIAFSIGYRESMAVGELRSGVTLGLGLMVDGMQFHYAYEQSSHVEFNSKNYFSIQINL